MENKSGIRAVEYKVLILPEAVEQKIDLGNGKEIWTPDITRDRESAAQVKGRLVSVGDSAFNDWSVHERAMLKPGTLVYFAKYQGIVLTGADGKEYRLCTDKDVSAVITDEGAGSSTLRGRKPGALAAA